MSEENVDLVRRAYEAWERNEVEVLRREIIHDDFEWRPYLGSAGVRATSYRGYEGMLAYRREVEEALGSLHVDVLGLEDFGDRVLAHVHTTGRGAASGVDVALETFHLWTFKAGKATELVTYEGRGEALAAAGLTE